ncbi:GntR family transcriptional regulator [Arthrobacter burdickii]|jgi:DNA-binding GntR family transcriptional regulator|uniref:GntR family transcriptional regulator n=1 Tax=Arthrobacter burdickii TaxID=3035920 RepID=A0ABT8JYQ5_9MICC|nr:GntR family transcriptional regulator [Arthrobacter burdickii]MDN4610301.1 GntR family transcriptional regulator [Arthrobacter burdickii]
MTAGLSDRSVPDIDRRGLRDRVYDRILDILLSSEMEPGARLSIDTLAKQLKVSPTPIREAMVQLERTGLVTREALKGYRVAPPLGAEQLDELFEARIMLEVEAARLAAPRAASFLPALQRAHEHHHLMGERVTAAMRNGDVPIRTIHDYFDADNAFHLVILDAARNRYVQDMYANLGALTHRMRQAVIRGTSDVSEAATEHAAILEAFASGDLSSPVAALRAHIEGVRARSLDDSPGA